MSGSYSSRLHAGAGGGLGATALLAAKVAFASAALGAAAYLARVAVPHLVSGADAFLWKLYLFVTVHVIIFVIWKLSDNKHFHAAAQQHRDPWAPTPHHPAPPLLTEEVVQSDMKRKAELAPTGATAEEHRVPPPLSRPHIASAASLVDEGVVSPGSCGGESCVTTESEEYDTSDAAAVSAYFAAVDTRRSVPPAPILQRAAVEPAVSLPPPPVMAATDEHLDGADHEDANNDDDLDATWNAIMQRTRPATSPDLSSSSSPAPRARARDPSRRSARRS